jgi:uncharacterized spore protein YtfJ
MIPRRAFATLSRLVSARQVFGKPVERKGVTVIPAAWVIGGGGGGGGEGPPGPSEAQGSKRSQGSGVGFGLIARPAGAFEVSADGVRWRPAIDATRLIGWGLIGVVLIARWMLNQRD